MRRLLGVCLRAFGPSDRAHAPGVGEARPNGEGMVGWRRCALLLAAVVAVVVVASGFKGHAAAVNTTLMSGTLVDASGNPISGAAVLVYPLEVGRASPVGQTTTDANGDYSVAVPDSAALQALAAPNGGYDNFDVDATAPTGTVTSVFSSEWTSSGWGQGNAARPRSLLVLKPGAPGAAMHRTPATYRRAIAFVSQAPDPGCVQQTTVLNTAVGQYTTSGEVHTANDAKETFTYGKSADSSIDVGFSATDSGFGINGSVHIGNSSKSEDQDSVGQDVGNRVDEEFTYQHQKVFNSCAGVKYLHIATAWDTGFRNGAGNHTLDGHCPAVGTTGPNGEITSHYPANAAHVTSNENMVKFSAAVTVFGQSLGSQSGWGTFVISSWKFGPNANHYLCGSNGTVAAASRIFAGLQQ